MTTDQIREATEFVKVYLAEYTNTMGREHFEVLLSLCESYLKVEGLPSKREFPKIEEVRKDKNLVRVISEIEGFNEALDLCNLAISKLYVLREGGENGKKTF